MVDTGPKKVERRRPRRPQLPRKRRPRPCAALGVYTDALTYTALAGRSRLWERALRPPPFRQMSASLVAVEAYTPSASRPQLPALVAPRVRRVSWRRSRRGPTSNVATLLAARPVVPVRPWNGRQLEGPP